MRTHLEFVSGYFQPVPGEEEETNEGIFGMALAEFLAAEFRSHGYEADLIPEDWGWLVSLKAPGEKLAFSPWFGCSSLDEHQWLVQIHPSKPFVRRWFKKIDVQPTISRIAELVERSVVEKASATNLRWWSDRESGRK